MEYRGERIDRRADRQDKEVDRQQADNDRIGRNTDYEQKGVGVIVYVPSDGKNSNSGLK